MEKKSKVEGENEEMKRHRDVESGREEEKRKEEELRIELSESGRCNFTYFTYEILNYVFLNILSGRLNLTEILPFKPLNNFCLIFVEIHVQLLVK